MSDDCIHGFATPDCATCDAGVQPSRASGPDRVGHEKLLVFCPRIAGDTLLHFNRQGESYRLRAYVGERAGSPAWTQQDAPTASEFLRSYQPEQQIDVMAEQVSVDRIDRWATIITAHNRRLGIGA